MAQNAYATTAEKHNDITAAANLLGDSLCVEGVEGGHYVDEFEDGETDGRTVTVRVSATVEDPDERSLLNVEADLWGLDGAKVELVETTDRTGFVAPVDRSGTFDQPTHVPEDSRLLRREGTFEVEVPVRGDEFDTRTTPIEEDRRTGAV